MDARCLLMPMVAALTLACSAGSGSSAPEVSAATSAPASDAPRPSPDVIDLPSAIVDPVVAEVARVAGVPASDVVVITAIAVTFPNAGLGCPEPGMAYAQVLVDGYRIVATAAGATFDYRGTSPGAFRRCS